MSQTILADSSDLEVWNKLGDSIVPAVESKIKEIQERDEEYYGGEDYALEQAEDFAYDYQPEDLEEVLKYRDFDDEILDLINYLKKIKVPDEMILQALVDSCEPEYNEGYRRSDNSVWDVNLISEQETEIDLENYNLEIEGITKTLLDWVKLVAAMTTNWPFEEIPEKVLSRDYGTFEYYIYLDDSRSVDYVVNFRKFKKEAKDFIRSWKQAKKLGDPKEMKKLEEEGEESLSASVLSHYHNKRKERRAAIRASQGVNMEVPSLKDKAHIKWMKKQAESAAPNLREELSEIFHDAWMHWSKAVADDVADARKAKWEESWVPYAQLDDSTKEMDREWADEAMKVIKPYLSEASKEEEEEEEDATIKPQDHKALEMVTKVDAKRFPGLAFVLKSSKESLLEEILASGKAEGHCYSTWMDGLKALESAQNKFNEAMSMAASESLPIDMKSQLADLISSVYSLQAQASELFEELAEVDPGAPKPVGPELEEETEELAEIED